jgi:hypothetical protein
MGLPKARIASSRGSIDATRSTVPRDIIEMLRDRIHRTVAEEHELAAKQHALLERASNERESTPERVAAFLNRIAEAERR